jgi:hypothetical protein
VLIQLVQRRLATPLEYMVFLNPEHTDLDVEASKIVEVGQYPMHLVQEVDTGHC